MSRKKPLITEFLIRSTAKPMEAESSGMTHSKDFQARILFRGNYPSKMKKKLIHSQNVHINKIRICH